MTPAVNVNIKKKKAFLLSEAENNHTLARLIIKQPFKDKIMSLSACVPNSMVDC